MAGVALAALGLLWWQAWHLVASTVLARGTCGTWRHSRGFCVAAVALAAWVGSGVARLVPVGRPAPRRFAWQAWHLVTSTMLLCGRCGTCFVANYDSEGMG